ncbi:MAG TPA: hypothetical protein VGD80_35210 [Kofleriaceae bacterium]
MRSHLALAVVLVACRNSSEAPAQRGAAGSAGSAASGSGSAASGSGSADPWAAQAAPRAPDTPETRKARAERALQRVATILPEVAKLRALTYDREVPRKYQLPAEFQAFVRREIARELPGERSRDLSAAFAHLGLLVKPIDIATVEEQAMTTQAGAYYDPAAKAFFLVMVPDSDLMLDTISAHELTHALQDQHFNLSRYLPSDGSLDEDAATARRFVVEGDATFVMLQYAMHGVLGDKISPLAMTTLRQQIAQFAALDVDALKAQVKAQSSAFGMMDGDIKKSIDAMDDIPPAVLVPLLDSYMKGALVALVAYERGGWPSVDKLYRKPPESSEQVLHPETKLFPVPERPRRVTLAKSADRELSGNVLGELQWRIYLELWKSPRAAEAAEGWGGDRYSVTRRSDGHLVGRIATTWDSPKDAAQFATAYIASLAARFPGADTRDPAAGIARPDFGKVFVRTIGKRVFIVDGARAAAELDQLIRTTRFDG